MGSKTNDERLRLQIGLAEMLKGGVIMDVTNVDQARMAEDAGAAAVMAVPIIGPDGHLGMFYVDRAKRADSYAPDHLDLMSAFAALTGILLASVAGWGLVHFLFELNFHLPVAALGALWLGVVVLTTTIGLANGRDALKKPPLAVIRELAE